MINLLGLSFLFFLAFINGANDVSKGIATLAGSGVGSLKKAISWGTCWTILGCLAGIYLSAQLIDTFSKSLFLLPLPKSYPFIFAISLSPSLWVLFATYKGWPVSTTHSIIGSLVGGGFFVLGAPNIAWSIVTKKMLFPLLCSPFLAIFLAFIFFPLLKKMMATIETYCFCLLPYPKIIINASSSLSCCDSEVGLLPIIDHQSNCTQSQKTWSFKKDQLHWLTSGFVSFSRGLNDAPKLIAALLPLLMLQGSIERKWLFLLVALGMGLGSWIGGRKITEVMGFKITRLDHDQGFVANFITAFLGIMASCFALPVSTTHVSGSAIMGVGLAKGTPVDFKKVQEMIFAWLVTIPVSALISIALYKLLSIFC